MTIYAKNLEEAMAPLPPSGYAYVPIIVLLTRVKSFQKMFRESSLSLQKHKTGGD